MRQTLIGPWLALTMMLVQLHTIADVLFTGGHPTAAVSAALFLIVWAYLTRPQAKKPADASSR